MTQLSDLLDVDKLAQEIADGFVTERRHPVFSEYVIYNYSAKTQFDQHWNDVTKLTRGLIVDTETGEVVARAFHKFFNLGDDGNGADLAPDQTIMGAWEKIDGSLGIVYALPFGGLSVATRGSFESEQAIHATQLLRKMPTWDIEWAHNLVDRGMTPVCEIVYPANRIVVDYGDRDELVWLGYIDNLTGAYHPNNNSTELPSYSFRTIGEALAEPECDNHEGLVLWLDEFTPVKLKYEKYKALHKVVTGLNEKEVWRQMRDGTFSEWVVELPDEFYKWATDVYNRISKNVMTIIIRVDYDYKAALAVSDNGRVDRKAFAESAKQSPFPGLVFAKLDNKDVYTRALAMVEPKIERQDHEQEAA